MESLVPTVAERGKKTGHKIAFGTLLALVFVLLFLSFVPLIETYRWWVRLADFPRLQIAIALLVLAMPVVFYLRYFAKTAVATLALMAAAFFHHAAVLLPYAPLGSELSPHGCPSGSDFSVMVANVKMHNDPGGKLIEIVHDTEADILLALETSKKWDRALADLTETMPHTVSHISDSYFSIHLFSRLPLESPEIRFLAGQGTPQIATGIRLRNGMVIDFLGIHPRPPMPDESALGRDAVLYEAGFLATESRNPALVAGDFNAVPWESATVMMRRIGRLTDPRRGYGFIPTFSAESWWMSWPLDQIFHQAGFGIVSLERLPDFGSDHYPLLGHFCWLGSAPHQPRLEIAPEALIEAKQAIKKARSGEEHN